MKRQTSHIDCRSANMWEEEPADDAANDIACRQRNVDVKGLELAEACPFQKDDRVPEDCIAAENLSRPNNAVLAGGNVSQQLNPASRVVTLILTISVRRRFVPRKHSMKPAFAVSAFFQLCDVTSGRPRWHPPRALSPGCLAEGASNSSWLLQVCPCGLRSTAISGARYAPMKRGIGQTHCRTNGKRQPRSPLIPATARTTPEERRIPPPQHMQT